MACQKDGTWIRKCDHRKSDAVKGRIGLGKGGDARTACKGLALWHFLEALIEFLRVGDVQQDHNPGGRDFEEIIEEVGK